MDYEPELEGGYIDLEKNLRSLARRTDKCLNKDGPTCRERIRDSKYSDAFTSGQDWVEVKCNECGVIGKMQRHNAGHLIKAHRHDAEVSTKL